MAELLSLWKERGLVRARFYQNLTRNGKSEAKGVPFYSYVRCALSGLWPRCDTAVRSEDSFLAVAVAEESFQF